MSVMRFWLYAATLVMLNAMGACAATPPAPAAAAVSDAPEVQAALNDAARVTGLAIDKLKLGTVERVTWRDGSLGCPEPDLMYTQALVPGLRIRIDAAGRQLEYHANTRGTVLLCPPERAVAPVAAPPPA